MVAFRNLDENGDWLFGKGKNDYARSQEAIKLDIKTRIHSWLGDCFFAVEDGIDWWNRLGSFDQRELLEQDLRLAILQTDGVTEIVDFSTELVDRRFSASYTVNTVYSKQFTDLIERTI